MQRNLSKGLWALVLTLALAACGGSHTTTAPADGAAPATESAEQGPEFTSAYVCPMHCEGSGSDQPGQCPVCGMDYVANDGHSHDGHSHDGHSH